MLTAPTVAALFLVLLNLVLTLVAIGKRREPTSGEAVRDLVLNELLAVALYVTWKHASTHGSFFAITAASAIALWALMLVGTLVSVRKIGKPHKQLIARMAAFSVPVQLAIVVALFVLIIA